MRSSTDPRGYATSYAYDGAGNLTSVTPPSQAFVPFGSTRVGATRITPDALSRPAVVTDAKGQMAGYTYDNLDWAEQIVYKNASGATDRTILHGYDNDGPIRTLTDPTGVTTYTIDDLLRLTREAFGCNGSGVLSYTHDYTYDQASLKTLTDAYGTTTYTYNGLSMKETLVARATGVIAHGSRQGGRRA